MQADLYSVNKALKNPSMFGSASFTGITGRVFPHAMIDWRYPLVREVGNVRQLIEPRVAVILAPNGNNPKTIPNEDSLDFEFDDTNLFLANRFPGLDKVSGGQWLVYGIGTGFYGDKGGKSSAFVGQTIRMLNPDDTFESDSGLDGRFSDIVGRVNLEPADYLNLAYRFRMVPQDFEIKRHELTSTFGPRELKFSVGYLFFANTGATAEFGDREEVTAAVTAKITDRWSIFGRTRHDLTASGGVLSNGIGIAYECDCFTFRMDFSRSFTRDRDFKASNRFMVQLVFKHLGEVTGSLD